LNLFVSLATPVVGQEFRAEFTRYAGGLGSGVRVSELDAFGYKLTNASSLDADTDIDFKDFAIFANNWMADNSGTGGANSVIDNFESGIGSWSNWVSHSVSQNYNEWYSDSSVVHTGTKSMQWIYSLTPGPQPVTFNDDSGLVYTFTTPIDLKNYGKFRIWLYRQAGNSLENYLAITFYSPGIVNDSRILAGGYLLSADGSSKTPSSIWSEWVIDFSTLSYFNPTLKSPADLSNVGSIVIAVCNRNQFVGGNGTIYVDDMSIDGKCTSPAGDFNGDCKENIDDLAAFCDGWLMSF
jgi:hypothetical protein